MSGKVFFFRLIAIALLAGLPVYLYILKNADSRVDPYYLRFTSKKQHSLIIGTSRAAQGLQPYVFDSVLKPLHFESPMFNFAFTLDDSPFGSGYFNAIRNKIDKATKRGIFIVTIDPYSLSKDTGNYTDNEDKFWERNAFVANMHFVNEDPNLEYLFRFYDKPIISLAYNKSLTMSLHKDGWLELTVPMDSESVKKRIKTKVEKYTDVANESNFSPVRYEYFKKTIIFLKEFGEVYVVRLPVSKEMRPIEEKIIPDFDKMIQEYLHSINVIYINFINESGNYKTIDGNHLYKVDGAYISASISNQIKNNTKYK